MIRKIANNQLFKTISSIVELVVTIFLIVLIILAGFQRFSEKGSFFGYRIFTVASGSMIPMYEIGDTLLVKDVPIKNITVGDAVTYKADVGKNSVNITHEVVDVEVDPDTGKYSFHTKGIANDVEDPIVGEEQVVGKVIYRFYILSLLGYVTTSKVLFLFVITIPMALLISIEIIKLIYGESEHFLKKAAKKAKKQEDKILDGGTKLLTEEERQKKIEAIRNGTNTIDKEQHKTIFDDSKPLTEEEKLAKIEKIKNESDEDTSDKKISEIIKKEKKEEIDFESISDIKDEPKEQEEQEEQEENKKEEVKKIKDEDTFLTTVQKLKEEYTDNPEAFDDKQIDEFLKYLKDKLSNEKEDSDKDKKTQK